MAALQVTVQPDELILEHAQGRMALTPVTPRVVRVRYTTNAAFSSRQSLMVLPQRMPEAPFTVCETPTCITFSTTALSIDIDRQTAACTYRNSDGTLLTKEPARGGKTLTPIDVVVSIFDDTTVVRSEMSADGMRSQAEAVRQRVDRQAYQTKLEFEWAPDEALYGLGSHEEGMLNLRGQHQYLYQQNMKAVVPVLISTRGYGILLDSYSAMTFHDDAFGSYLWSEVSDELDFYFVYGPDFDQIIHELRELTGKAPMFPKWTFGYLQSKERYTSQAELVEVVQEYRQRGLPLDCIVLDWMSWSGDLWGQKSLDPARFPDPDQMMRDLHDLHAHLMVSIWPNMRAGGSDWQAMKERGYLLGNQSTYDAFDADARALYWQQANDGLFSHGIDAWWCDCTEPFEADWNGAVRAEPEARLHINTEAGKRYLDPAYINAYSLLHSQGIYEGQRAITAQKRVVNLTRSAYMGQQRYATITWSGDIVATWETLRRQIADGLNFCVTGVPYWTLDVGGFFVGKKPELWFWSGDYDDGVDDMGYRELFVRWFQYATFLPMLRAHGTDTPREIWRFGEPGDAMYDTLVKFLNLRYRLMPYIYALAGWTTLHDYTMLRLLAFDFRDDVTTYDIRDQFMFGPAFLVCPITKPTLFTTGSQPVIDEEKARPVYLPAGSDWWDFWSGERLTGGQHISAGASIMTIPLFVRAGSIVPTAESIQYVDENRDGVLELHVYPGCDGNFLLYEDAGDGYDYEQGAFSTIEFRWYDASRQFEIGERTGSYPGMQEQRTFRIMLHDARQTEFSQGTDRPGTIVTYQGARLAMDL